MAKRKQAGGTGPGGGEPGADLGGSPEPGPVARGKGRQARYTAEQKRGLLEALAKSEMGVAEFARTMGVAADSLYRWKRSFEASGPRGLEPGPRGRPVGSGRGSTLPGPVQTAIVSTKRLFPAFGLRSIRDYLARILQLRVSMGGVRRVLRDAEIPALPKPRKRRRRSEEPRRFERARPGELWQSDITSYYLGRHNRRVYLTVFLDDFSRYVVAWNLQLHQRQELVSECLLDGIQKFGKPKEVLTDQGRQYFAWRGKSDFQKLLKREGIEHVVARTHHPETLGKCERLWKTVGVELVDRAEPKDLEEMRERLRHYFKHYNHFRPHQGLDGMTPADRFFGVADHVRKEVEGGQAENALRLALGEPPQARSFLVGNLDGHQVTVRRTEKGLEIEAADGTKTVMGPGTPGATGKGGSEDEGRDGGDEDEEGEGPEASSGLPDAPPGGGGGAGAVGAGERGGEEAGARGGDHDPVLVAGGDEEVGGGLEAAGDGAAAVADGPDGAQRDDGGSAEAAAGARAAGVGGGVAAAAGGGTGEGTLPGAGAGGDSGGDAGAP